MWPGEMRGSPPCVTALLSPDEAAFPHTGCGQQWQRGSGAPNQALGRVACKREFARRGGCQQRFVGGAPGRPGELPLCS